MLNEHVARFPEVNQAYHVVLKRDNLAGGRQGGAHRAHGLVKLMNHSRIYMESIGGLHDYLPGETSREWLRRVGGTTRHPASASNYWLID